MKALELANEYRTSMPHEVMISWGSDAAIELRRLAEMNAELLGALEKFERASSKSESALEFSTMCDEFIVDVRATIAKAKEQQ